MGFVTARLADLPKPPAPSQMDGMGVPLVILDSILGWFSSDLAIDLGTANTLV